MLATSDQAVICPFRSYLLPDFNKPYINKLIYAVGHWAVSFYGKPKKVD